ncbi:hypothetical protein [Paenibacillus glycanilyticus]|uniref:Uncharacterized protein n=1 Tax=Paenibacillus glycanilyticus TaxID=126569 RepID=A0ABQ6G8L8_9BACL|nr:hypothetical protein [Paenibacillus glycanilyticus]GLX67291.1 hypothetical protein MU1_16360 [Paenibacillus glycanilyticus]
MGTRLWWEQAVRQRFPHIRYVTIRSSGHHKATIYAWDDQLELSTADAAKLHRYASEWMSPDICVSVKPYNEAAADQVPRDSPDEDLVKTALRGRLDQSAVFAVLNGLFAGVVVSFNRYDVRTGTVHLAAFSHSPFTDIAKSKIRHYAEELMPVGSTVNVTYYG